MDLIELLQIEIHDLKMQWSKLKEENVVLKGFKAMVMQEPKKYHKPGPGHNGPPDDGEEQDNPTVFDVARDDFKKELNWKEKYDKEHKLRLEAEGETHLVKAVGMNSPEMKAANAQIKNLEDQLSDTLMIEDDHQKFNGKLQMRLTELEQEIIELHADNKKLAHQVEDKVNQLRKAGLL